MLRGSLICFLLLFAFLSNAQPGKEGQRKLSYGLVQKLKEVKPGDSLPVNFSYHRYVSGFDSLIRIIHHYKEGRIISGKAKASHIYSLAGYDEVIFIGLVQQAVEELNTGIFDLSLNKISFAQDRFSQYKGDSVHTTLKERLFDTTDIDLKGRIFKTGLENSTVTAHASLMATILAGAGNSSPFALGVAPAARTGSVSFSNLLPEPDSFYQAHRISVQNHSYGTVIENFYGNDAAAYDASAFNNPTLLHVYSSGNSGAITSTTGPYANIQAYANLTGNVKHAKNLLVVGATDSLGQVQGASSRGPVHDGRIKPELVAFGEDGSSGASALVSGAAVLVQDAYRKLHGDSLPSSSLVKSVLINSADDADVPNVDHRTGFGHLNAFKAIKTIQERNILHQSIGHGQTKTYPLNVPANAARLKVTLVWTDPPALAGSSKALVNDLDLNLHDPSGSIWLPWVLSSAPNRDSIQLSATRKRDTVNNVEQVTIDLPSPGNYVIQVKASRMISTAQDFSIAWSIDPVNTFYWTFPAASTPLVAGNTHTLRWETNIAGNGTMEFSHDGTTWQQVGTITGLKSNFFKWQVPDTLSAGLLRMNISGHEPIVSDTFIISPRLDLKAGFDCADSFFLFWQKIPAQYFEVSELKERYLEPVHTTVDTTVIFHKTQHPSLYFSVAPVIGSRKGIRSNTLNYRAAANGCYSSGFYLQYQTKDAAFFGATLGTTAGIARIGLQKLSSGHYRTVRELLNPSITSFAFSDSSLIQGENYYRLIITLTNGSVVYSDPVLVYHFTAESPVIVYPNPVKRNNEVTILSNDAGRYTIQVTDGQGRVLLTKTLNATRTQLPLSNFSGGLYFIRVIDRDGKPFVRKLLVF